MQRRSGDTKLKVSPTDLNRVNPTAYSSHGVGETQMHTYNATERAILYKYRNIADKEAAKYRVERDAFIDKITKNVTQVPLTVEEVLDELAKHKAQIKVFETNINHATKIKKELDEILSQTLSTD